MINAGEKVKGIYLAREENSVVGHLIPQDWDSFHKVSDWKSRMEI